jgi:hypothetical protein
LKTAVWNVIVTVVSPRCRHSGFQMIETRIFNTCLLASSTSVLILRRIPPSPLVTSVDLKKRHCEE